MRDGLGRQIDYLRVSVTDRCNFRCQYCMPARGKIWFPREEILSFEEIHTLVRDVFIPLGLTRIRLTGGEPLLRQGLATLVTLLRGEPALEDLALSTNGVLLEAQAGGLAAAGIDRVNISLDTLEGERFRRITRGGNLEIVLRGVRAALEAGMHPVKINCVVVPGLNLEDVIELARLTIELPVHVRFIEFMPVGDRELFEARGTVTISDVAGRLRERFELVPVAAPPAGNGPADHLAIRDAMGTLGFIHPMSRHFCDACNRLRLTANGHIKACLLTSGELDLKTPLRQGASADELRQLVQSAVAIKPDWHHMGDRVQALTMSQVGG